MINPRLQLLVKKPSVEVMGSDSGHRGTPVTKLIHYGSLMRVYRARGVSASFFDFVRIS